MQSHEGATGHKAQSVDYAATIKALNPDCRAVYAKVAAGANLEFFCNEIVAIFGDEALQIEITLYWLRIFSWYPHREMNSEIKTRPQNGVGIRR